MCFINESELDCNYGKCCPFPTGRALPALELESESATYVNIPISPTSKKQLHYMELELQEQGSGSWATSTHTPSQSKKESILGSCSKDETMCLQCFYKLYHYHPQQLMSFHLIIFSPELFQITVIFYFIDQLLGQWLTWIVLALGFMLWLCR